MLEDWVQAVDVVLEGLEEQDLLNYLEHTLPTLGGRRAAGGALVPERVLLAVTTATLWSLFDAFEELGWLEREQSAEMLRRRMLRWVGQM